MTEQKIDLVINKLTKAKYDELLNANQISDTELYFITDDNEKGAYLTAQSFTDLVEKGTDIVVDVAQDNEHVEIHLDQLFKDSLATKQFVQSSAMLDYHYRDHNIFDVEFFNLITTTPKVQDGALFSLETKDDTTPEAIANGFPQLDSGSIVYGYFYNGLNESPMIMICEKGLYKITDGTSKLTCSRIGASIVQITAPEGATNGNLNETQLNILKSSDMNYIMFNNEIYILMDKTHTSDTLTYSHLGFENGKHQVKTISITISTLAWVLNKTEIGAGIKQATETELGGVKAAPKTDTDNQEVHIDTSTGKLFTRTGYSEMEFSDQEVEGAIPLKNINIGTDNWKISGGGGGSSGGGLQYVTELPEATEAEFNKHGLYLYNGSTYYLYRRVKDFKSAAKKLDLQGNFAKSCIIGDKLFLIGGDSANILTYDPTSNLIQEVVSGLYNAWPRCITVDEYGKLIMTYSIGASGNIHLTADVYDPKTNELITGTKSTIKWSNNYDTSYDKCGAFVINSKLDSYAYLYDYGGYNTISTYRSKIIGAEATTPRFLASNPTLSILDADSFYMYDKEFYGTSEFLIFREYKDYYGTISFIDRKTYSYTKSFDINAYFNMSSDVTMKIFQPSEKDKQFYLPYKYDYGSVYDLYSYDYLGNEVYKMPKCEMPSLPNICKFAHSQTPMSLINDKLYIIMRENGVNSIYEIEPEFEYKYAKM